MIQDPSLIAQVEGIDNRHAGDKGQAIKHDLVASSTHI